MRAARAAAAPPPPDVLPDGRPGVPADESCVEPARRLLYDRVLRYWEKPLDAPFAPGTCKVCGAATPVGDKGFCRAQRTLTARHAASPEGVPPRFGGPTAVAKRDRGDHCLAIVGNAILAGADGSVVVARAMPTHPLPDDVVTVAPGGGALPALVARVLADPPATPFALVTLDRKCNVPFEPTIDRDRVVTSGGPLPLAVDRRLVADLTELARSVGPSAFKEGCVAKRRLAEGLEGAADEVRQLLERHPALVAAWPRLAPYAYRREAYLAARAAGDG